MSRLILDGNGRVRGTPSADRGHEMGVVMGHSAIVSSCSDYGQEGSATGARPTKRCGASRT